MASLHEGRWRCAAVRGLAGAADVVLALPPAARVAPPRACGSSSLAAAVVDQLLDSLHSSVGHVADAVSRVEGVMTDLRERVARLDGAQAAVVRGG